jgi:ankyrin repeat protein
VDKAAEKFFDKIRAGDFDKIKTLLDAGMDPNTTDSEGASALNTTEDVKVARLLIERGANVNAFKAPNCSPLVVHAGAGNIKIVELLLNSGADPNLFIPGCELCFASTALTCALCFSEHTPKTIAVCKMLFKAGANPNTAAHEGETALFGAVYYCDQPETLAPALVKLLLDAGADPSIKNIHGKTALDLAKEKGNREVLAMLKARTK